jgi:opacity protein-like surface antigen
MIKRFLLFSLILLPVLISAQQTQVVPASHPVNGIFLDASLGASLPAGAYAGSDPGNTLSGFSKSGVVVQLSCDWMGKKDFGLALQYTFQQNPFKNNSNDSILAGMSVPAKSGNWTNHYLMAGPVFMKYFGKVLIEAKALAGVIIATSPLFRTEDPAFKSVSNNTGTGLAFGLGAGAGYEVSPNVAVKINVAYQIGTPKINRQYGGQIIGYNSKDSVWVYSAPVKFETKKIVSSFNLELSIIFKISN